MDKNSISEALEALSPSELQDAEQCIASLDKLASAVAYYAYIEGVEHGRKSKQACQNMYASPMFCFLKVGREIAVRAEPRRNEWELSWDYKNLVVYAGDEQEAFVLDALIRRVYGAKALLNSFTHCCDCGKPAICKKHRGDWLCESCLPLKDNGNPQDALDLSFVYVIGHPEIGYKIGVSKTPQNRLKQIDRAAQFPYPVEIAHLIPVHVDSAFTLEARLHQKYGECRMRGEWFKLTEPQLIEIKSLEVNTPHPAPARDAAATAAGE